MKLVKRSETELIIRDRPGIFKTIFIAVWSSFFIGIPSLLMFATIAGAGVSQLNCTKLEPQQLTCETSKSRYFGLIPGETSIHSQVEQAQFNQTEGVDSDGDDTVDNWVSLVTAQSDISIFEGAIRFNGTLGSESDMQALADEINTYIEEDLASFTVDHDLRLSLSGILFPILFCSVFLLIGLAVLYWTLQMRVARFDRNLNRFFLKKYTLLGIKTTHLSFSEILGVRVKSNVDDEGNSTHTLLLRTTEHTKLTLGTTSWRLKYANELKQDINEFLSLD